MRQILTYLIEKCYKDFIEITEKQFRLVIYPMNR